ncbi:hypothetical protein ACHAQD_011999 [Fusarium lateritium]
MSYVGNLVGDQWQQYSNVAGQVYYVQAATGASQYSIPPGWEDHPQDNWNYSATQQQWVNTRTGRTVFHDPNPPPAQTYLDKRNVMAHLQTVERNPGTNESTYRRATTGILRWLFREDEGFDVVQEEHRGNSIADHVVFKIECRQGGSFYAYDFLMVECKTNRVSWQAATDHCINHCENTDNPSGKVYAMVQVGMNIQLHSWDSMNLTPISGILHLRNDVQEIIDVADWMKSNPLPAVQ